LTSVGAAYTVQELRELTAGTKLKGCEITSDTVGLTMAGVK
jgi:hypothetical protein